MAGYGLDFKKAKEWGGLSLMPGADDAKMPVNPANYSILNSPSSSLGVDLKKYSFYPEGDLGTQFGEAGVAAAAPALPKKEGGWTTGLGYAKDIAGIGLGVFNAMEQSKMNKFMRGYYGDQMDLQRADFANAAKGTNEALAGRQGRILSAQGATTGTDANKAGVAEYMKQWGVQETV